MDQPKNTACQAVAGQCDALAKQLRSDLEARAEALAQEYSRQIASRLEGLKKERTRWQKQLSDGHTSMVSARWRCHPRKRITVITIIRLSGSAGQ